MKELYKTYLKPGADCLQQPKQDNDILEKYLANKKNLQSFQQGTILPQNSIAEKHHKVDEKLNDVFSSRTTEIIEALQGYSPGKVRLRSENNWQNENAHLDENTDLEKSIEYIDETFRSIKQTIENPDKKQLNLEKPREGVRQFSEEKSDKPKLCNSTTTFSFENTQEQGDRVERILKMVEIDYKPSRQLQPAEDKNMPSFKGPFDIDYWDEQFQQYTYYAFFILLCTLFLVSILRSTYFAFKTTKKYFDKALLHCWSWVRGIFAPSHPSNEQNIILFVLFTPFIILLLIAYSGFSILYFVNKILLSRVPNVITQQINPQKNKGFENCQVYK